MDFYDDNDYLMNEDDYFNNFRGEDFLNEFDSPFTDDMLYADLEDFEEDM